MREGREGGRGGREGRDSVNTTCVPPCSSVLLTTLFPRFSLLFSGFGFVVYEQKHEAEAAISRMDNAELDGRTLRVNFARPR